MTNKTTLRVDKVTQKRFNLKKINNGFNSADEYINFLMNLSDSNSDTEHSDEEKDL